VGGGLPGEIKGPRGYRPVQGNLTAKESWEMVQVPGLLMQKYTGMRPNCLNFFRFPNPDTVALKNWELRIVLIVSSTLPIGILTRRRPRYGKSF